MTDDKAFAAVRKLATGPEDYASLAMAVHANAVMQALFSS
jgi:hypothetical protein